jgi:hypothetical protein
MTAPGLVLHVAGAYTYGKQMQRQQIIYHMPLALDLVSSSTNTSA